jgi:putative hemolysin
MSESILWLILNIASVVVLAFFSMIEMATVSFNKLRLQYYVKNGDTRAIRLQELLQNPSTLFGATLIGVNVALVFGSEFARQFYSSIGLSPDWAPLTQVLLVVIFGELAPMFAARVYNENVSLLGIPILYSWAKLMSPFLWVINKLTHVVNLIIGDHAKHDGNFYITQEELQKLLEENEEESNPAVKQEFNVLVRNVFSLRKKTAEKVMNPLITKEMIPTSCTIGEMRDKLKQSSYPFLLVYLRNQNNIVGVAFPRDLVKESDNKKIGDLMKQPWFITQNTPILQILKQFKRNNQSLSIVLNDKGQAIGILTLADLIDEIFGHRHLNIDSSPHKKENLLFIERTVPGETKISDINKTYRVQLDSQGVDTLAELIVKNLDHQPEVGDVVFIHPFELIVQKASFGDVINVTIKTRNK